nr:polymorphic toxin-type HINT domain-containing protein [Aquimarina longa]
MGDLVWAYNEETGESDLKPVVTIIEKEIDATIQLTLGNEVIETTAEHPFYTQNGWKDAADLTTTDQVKTKNGNWQRIEATNFLYSKKKVYNFEVADWHTYFVGAWEWLVHNAKVCLHALAKTGVKYAQNILRGIRFNQIMQKRIVNGVHELWTKGMKTRLDTLIPGKAIISRKATQLSEVTFNTAKKYKKGKAIQNTKRAGAKELDGKYVLQIPKQNKDIPKKIVDYAKKKRVEIDEIKDVTMDMLKWW